MLAGYVRTSRSHQDFERQVDDLGRTYSVDEWYVDRGETGTDTERGEFQRMMSELGGIDLVVVTEVSRLTRSMADLPGILDSFEEHGVSMRSLGPMPEFDPDSTLSGAMVQIVAALAEFENEQRRERIQSGVDRARREGKHVGAPPIGYAVNGKGYLVKDDVEWRVLEAATADLRDGATQLAVAEKYGPLTQGTLSKVLTRIEDGHELYSDLEFDRLEWEHAKVDAQ